MTWVRLEDIKAALNQADAIITAAFQGHTDLRPVADFGAVPGTTALSMNFTDSSFDPKGGTIVTWRWTFGDGQTSSLQNPSHTYAAAGVYAVTLIVTDNSGLAGSSTAAQTLVAPEDPTDPDQGTPTANFSVLTSGLTATFTDLSTDTDGHIAYWFWSFGEGPTANFSTSINNLQVTFTDTSTDVAPGHVVSWRWTFGDAVISTAQNPVHTYANGGTYQVTLTSMDNERNTGTKTASITVSSGQVVPLGRPLGMQNFWTGTNKPTISFSLDMSLDAITASSIVNRLAAIKAANFKMIFAMTGGSHNNYITAGAFDIIKWKAVMDTYNTPAIKAAVAQAVAEGYLLGNSVMDEPPHPTWGGVMTKPLLDSMATYVKAIFPTLPVGVAHGGYASWRTNESYTVMDWVQAQWWRQQANTAAFITIMQALEAADGVHILYSMNVIDGGTTVASCPIPTTGGPGTFGGHCRVTASQLQTEGLQLTPHGLGFHIWRYDTDMFGQAAYTNALAAISADLATRPTVTSWLRS